MDLVFFFNFKKNEIKGILHSRKTTKNIMYNWYAKRGVKVKQSYKMLSWSQRMKKGEKWGKEQYYEKKAITNMAGTYLIL